MNDPRHRCPCCGRDVPHAPGFFIAKTYTWGVAHVVDQDPERGMESGKPCRGGNYIKYAIHDHLRNLEELLEGPVVNDGTFLIGPGIYGTGQTREVLDDWDRSCFDCGGPNHLYCGRS